MWRTTAIFVAVCLVAGCGKSGPATPAPTTTPAPVIHNSSGSAAAWARKHCNSTPTAAIPWHVDDQYITVWFGSDILNEPLDDIREYMVLRFEPTGWVRDPTREVEIIASVTERYQQVPQKWSVR